MLGGVGSGWLQHGVPGRWEFPAQLGIIAGTAGIGLGRLLTSFDGPHDGTVAVAETHIDGAADRCELPVSHTSMWLSADVAQAVARFLESGHFT
jgi:hypothetical protein